MYKAWNKDKPLTEEHKKAISEKMKGREPWNKGIKTGVGGNTGRKLSEEHRARIAEAMRRHRENLRRERTSE